MVFVGAGADVFAGDPPKTAEGLGVEETIAPVALGCKEREKDLNEGIQRINGPDGLTSAA